MKDFCQVRGKGGRNGNITRVDSYAIPRSRSIAEQDCSAYPNASVSSGTVTGGPQGEELHTMNTTPRRISDITSTPNEDKVVHPELQKLTSQKGMKFLSWNIRSLPKHVDELYLLLDTCNIDIISFSESWLGKDNHNNQFRLPNYKMYRNDRTGKKKGGGLCTYVKGSLSCNALRYHKLNLSNLHLETLVLDIKLQQTRPIILINVYRPPSGKVTEGMDMLQKTY